MQHVSVIGAGAWGTALALAAFRAGSKVTLWSINFDEVETINLRHENVYRLPGIALDPSIQATLNPEEASKVDVLLLAPPAQFMRSTCQSFQPFVAPHIPLIIASKGIENESCLLMSEVVREIFPQNPLLILSGPSFASDVAKRLPTAIVLAAQTLALGQEVSPVLASSHFRLYGSTDLIGVQVAGACKNVIAIACGIAEGRELGQSACAALLTRGLAEIARLGCAMGARPETFLGLSGVGDITLTALSNQSRNKSFGLALGQGTPLQDLLAKKETLTEGAHTVAGAHALAQRYQVHMPLTAAIYSHLRGEETIETLIEHFLNRPLALTLE